MSNYLENVAKKLVHEDSALLWEHDANDYISLFMYKYADKITIVEVKDFKSHDRAEIVFHEDILDAPDLYEIKEEDKLRYE